MSGKLDVELVYSGEDRDKYSIKSDFPLTATKPDWYRSARGLFREKQRVDGTAMVGEGVDRVRIRVEGGMVYRTRKSASSN